MPKGWADSGRAGAAQSLRGLRARCKLFRTVNAERAQRDVPLAGVDSLQVNQRVDLLPSRQRRYPWRHRRQIRRERRELSDAALRRNGERLGRSWALLGRLHERRCRTAAESQE